MRNRNFKILLLLIGITLTIILSHNILHAQEQTDNTTAATENPTEEILPDVPMAEDFLSEDSSTRRTTDLGWRYWVNLILSLAIVIVFIYLLSYLFKYLFAKLPGYRTRNDFKVLNTLRLTTHASIHVVRFADEIYILAITPQKVTVISKITEPEKVQEILDTMPEEASGVNPHAFNTLLSKRISEVDTKSFSEKQKSRIEDQKHFRDTASRLKNIERSSEEDEL